MLNGLHLDKSSAVPLYEQLRKGLLECITSGEFPIGSRMPTEEELCSAYGISRPVARQAYNALIEAGYVERMRGRGTFVKVPESRGQFIDKQLSFAQEMNILGMQHNTELISAKWLTYDAKIYAQLRLEKGQRCLHIIRKRFVEGRPFVLVENFVPEPQFPGIDRFDFGQRSLYSVFSEVYNRRIAHSHRTMAAILANDEIAAALGTYRGAPVMYVKNLVFDQNDCPIDLSKEYLDGYSQKFEFDVINK